jgi:RNA polymerase sigma-70 factor (ECF subfamily)
LLQNNTSRLAYITSLKPNFYEQNDFVLLVNPFKDKVFRLAKRLLVSTEEAEDATRSFGKLWNRNGLSDFGSVEAFAMTMKIIV